MGNWFDRHHLTYKGDLVGFLDIPIPLQSEPFGSCATLQLNAHDIDRKTLKYLIKKSFKLLKEQGYDGGSLILQQPYALLTEDIPITKNLLTLHEATRSLHVKTLNKWMDTDKILKVNVEVHQWNR